MAAHERSVVHALLNIIQEITTPLVTDVVPAGSGYARTAVL
jgi:hypothetical protein